MTLTRAIEVAQDILTFIKPGDPPDEHDALKLLIEAGKVVRETRQFYHNYYFSLLPGETEE